jgi:hypothetical protein
MSLWALSYHKSLSAVGIMNKGTYHGVLSMVFFRHHKTSKHGRCLSDATRGVSYGRYNAWRSAIISRSYDVRQINACQIVDSSFAITPSGDLGRLKGDNSP